MMRKTISKSPGMVLIVALVAVVLGGCFSRGNDYMNPESDAYQTTTAHLVGERTIASLEGKPATTLGDLQNDLMEYIGPVYEFGTVEFQFNVRADDFVDQVYPAVRFSFEVDQDTLAEKESEWQKDYPDLDLTAMQMAVEGVWYVSPSGTELRIIVDPDRDGRVYVEATGTPEDQAGQFAGVQSAALAAAFAAEDQGAEGGLLGRAVAAVVEETASGMSGLSEIYPPDLDGMFNLEVSAEDLTFSRSTAVVTAQR